MEATTRGHWLDEGLRLLSEEGAQALRIDRLCAEVGLSKGSFYHHFSGMPGYRTALLEHVERATTTSFIETVSTARAHEPADQIRLLMDLVLADRKLRHRREVALRAWAQQDAEAAETQRRIDKTRVDFVRRLLVDVGVARAEAHALARTIYFVLIGGGHVVPEASAAELRRSWDRLLDPVLGRPLRRASDRGREAR